MVTHSSLTIPTVTMGGAGGFFKTGRFVDYRRMQPDSKIIYAPQANFNPEFDQQLGILNNQFFANVLLAMGIPRPEFERWGHRGYGYPIVTTKTGDSAVVVRNHYSNTSSRYFQVASDPLPGIT